MQVTALLPYLPLSPRERLLIARPALNGMPSRAVTDLNKETEMPKMKTKSSAKKRFKVTATGKVIGGQAGKRHGMIKRTKKFIRDARGTTVLSEPDAKIIKGFMPYDR
jgi:large subunit ribosomal protein L35